MQLHWSSYVLSRTYKYFSVEIFIEDSLQVVVFSIARQMKNQSAINNKYLHKPIYEFIKTN